MPVTHKKIASVTVTGATAANMEFTSIPGTYTDLLIKVSARTNHTSVANLKLLFNGADTNFSFRNLYGSGTAAASSSGSTSLVGILQGSNYTASTFSSNEIYIPNYAGSTNKSVSTDGVTENNATESYQVLTASLWSQTSAITSIRIDPGVGSFIQYSTAVLYGISKS